MGKGSDSSQAYSIYWKAVNRMVQIWESTRIHWVWFILECLHKEDTHNDTIHNDTQSTKKWWYAAGCIQVLPQYQLSSHLSTWNSSVIFHVANQWEAACLLGRQYSSFQFGDVPPDGNHRRLSHGFLSVPRWLRIHTNTRFIMFDSYNVENVTSFRHGWLMVIGCTYIL